MSDEQFIEKYEELLNKGYCDCNEMNCLFKTKTQL